MKTWVVEVKALLLSEERLAAGIADGDPAVMGRVRDGTLVLDVRTVSSARRRRCGGAGVGDVARPNAKPQAADWRCLSARKRPMVLPTGPLGYSCIQSGG